MANRDVGAYSIGGWSIGASEAPANQPPTFTSSPVTSVRATQSYSYSVTTTDPEADTITLTAPVLPAWMTLVDNGDGTGTLSGSPTKALAGDHSVTLRATATGGSTDQSFTVHVRNFGIVRGMKGAVQIPAKVWEREWLNYFQHTSAEITKADYHSAGGSIVDAAVDGPPGFTEYNTISICDDGTTFSNLYNPGAGDAVSPKVGNLMMSWYMKRADGGAASVGLNSTTGSCYTRIFGASSIAGQVGEEAVGDGWYRGWCTVYGVTGGGLLNTGLLRSATQYANDGNSKLYVTCYQLEPIVPGVVDETTGPSPFRPTTDYAYGERKRLRSTTAWTPNDTLVTNLVNNSDDFSDAQWTKVNSTGALNLITASVGTHSSRVDHPVLGGVVVGDQFVYTIKALSGTHQYLWIGDRGNAPMRSATIDLSDGSIVGQESGVTVSTEMGKDGRWLITFTHVRTWAGTASIVIGFGGASHSLDVPSATYAGTETLQVWGVQAEEGATTARTTETGFVPTTAGDASRVFGNNVIYLYKGAEQPLKDFGALALGFNMDLVTDLVYDLVQDLVRD
jgi:hypothetical protein